MAPSASQARRRRKRRLRTWLGDPFVYLPLDSSRREIRVLTIAPGQWEDLADTLRCTTSHVLLPVQTDEDDIAGDEADRASEEDEVVSDENPLGDNEQSANWSDTSGGTNLLQRSRYRVLVQSSESQVDSSCQSSEEPDPMQGSDIDDRSRRKAKPEKAEYETISYVWGDESQRDFIFLDGLLFDLPRSSEKVLRRMRLPDRPRTVWIDAVCINQMDAREKSRQVAMMGDVYLHGQQNLIWLGDAPERTQLALNDIQLLLDTEIMDAIKDGHTLVDIMYNSEGAPRFDTTEPTVDIDEDALAEFYARPWFSRLWVQQEMALAKHNICLCGPFNIDLESILMAAAWVEFKGVQLPGHSGIPAASMLDRIDSPHSVSRRSKPSLANLLATARDLACVDLRDKVYAIIGLIDWSTYGGLPQELTPDYSQSVADVLSLAGSWAIRSQQWRAADLLLRRISHHSDEDIRLDNLPSWIPRWHRPLSSKDTTPFQARSESTPTGLSVDLSRVVSQRTHQGLQFKWIVRSLFLGVFHEVHTGLSDSFIWQEFPRRYLTPLRPLLLGYNGNEDPDVALYDVLTASTWADGRPLNSHHVKLMREWLEDSMSQSPSFSAKSVHNLQCGIAVVQACQNRVIAELEGGHPVLTPGITARGDILVWISGCEYPTVLRARGEEYHVIGQAYAYDINNSKALVEWKRGLKSLESFTLI